MKERSHEVGNGQVRKEVSRCQSFRLAMCPWLLRCVNVHRAHVSITRLAVEMEYLHSIWQVGSQ